MGWLGKPPEERLSELRSRSNRNKSYEEISREKSGQEEQ